jgi:hypothetical protein
MGSANSKKQKAAPNGLIHIGLIIEPTLRCSHFPAKMPRMSVSFEKSIGFCNVTGLLLLSLSRLLGNYQASWDQELAYSSRNASDGFTAAARRAGRNAEPNAADDRIKVAIENSAVNRKMMFQNCQNERGGSDLGHRTPLCPKTRFMPPPGINNSTLPSRRRVCIPVFAGRRVI